MTLKQVFIVNKDLKMTCGKVCVQIAHGEVLYIEDVLNIPQCNKHADSKIVERYFLWREKTNGPIGMMKKIVLKATEQEILDITENMLKHEIKCYLVFDKGMTQVPQDSLTAICIEPIEEEKAKELFGSLKLL